jgi:biopolymer transport protein TolR
MASSDSSYDGDGPVANINVTPLVDVMLVLLVIFMVTAPMLQQGVEVNLPKSTNAPLEGKSEQLVVSIDRAGDVYLGSGNKLTVVELSEKLKALLDQRGPEDRKVYIKGDSALEYGRIMDLMGALHEAGIHQIGLVSAPADRTPADRKS